MNVITNAIKYNKIGGTVWCKIKEKNLGHGQVEFAVKVTDSGIGMKEEFIDKIYEPFAQERYGARSEYTGTGLGMPIVKNLLDKMYGTISIQSKVDM